MRCARAVVIALGLAACGGDEQAGARLDPADVASAPDLVGPGDDAATTAAPVDTTTVDDTSRADDMSSADDTTPDDTTPDDTASPLDTAVSNDTGPTIAERCFPGVDPAAAGGPVYDPLGPVIGAHCMGTDHQEVTGVEAVVFLGDSVTVGTPNLAHLLSIDNSHFYRNLLAEWLADHFGLDRGDPISWGFWKAYDYFSGQGGKRDSGAFRHCAKWGARTDDLLDGGAQIGACFPDGGSPKRTLVVFTMGGNDVAAITKKGAEASPEEVAAGYPEARALAAETVQWLDAAVAWLRDPARFPNGSYVVFANPFEFTDGTGRTDACSPRTKLDIPGIGELDLATLDIPVADLGGFGAWADPVQQRAIVVGMLEGYMRVAVEHQVDLVLMLERFCGHGYVATGAEADAQNACYQGPDADLWFDETCIHPSVSGHQAIFEMFRAVIQE